MISATAKGQPAHPVVTGYGLLTSLGTNAVQNAALVRAAISHIRAISPTETAGVIQTHSSRDASWTAHIERFLANPLFEALWRAGGVEALTRRRVRTYCAFPSFARMGTDAADIHDLPARMEGLLRQLEITCTLRFFADDQVAGLSALATARQDLMEGSVDVALVIALDSQLNHAHMADLARQARLKTADTSSGLIPGDACAVLILETDRAARQRGKRVHGSIGSVALADDGVRILPDTPIRANALSQVLRTIVQQHDVSAVKDVFIDLTGERWRFLEWALAETRCLAGLPYGYTVSHPADCLGDTGAAASLVLTVLALRAFARGYAAGSSVLLVASNDAGKRGAMLVHAPNEIS